MYQSLVGRAREWSSVGVVRAHISYHFELGTSSGHTIRFGLLVTLPGVVGISTASLETYLGGQSLYAKYRNNLPTAEGLPLVSLSLE
jgi:hypothetical protein